MNIHLPQIFFNNYERSKIFIDCPTFFNLIILSSLFILALLSITKKSTIFLDVSQTDHLKGIAILLVIVGHLWVHVIRPEAVPVLGGYSVALFLSLSGFGLTLSYERKPLDPIRFIYQRIRKIMIPYWIVTLIILCLDYAILNRSYSLSSIILTLFGINFNEELLRIDYSRWFITFLLLYYLAFILANYYLNHLGPLKCIFTIALIISLLRIYRMLPIGTIDQIFAFPLGCLLGKYYAEVYSVLSNKRLRLMIIALILFFMVIFSFVCSNAVWLSQLKHMEKLVLIVANGINSILFSALLITISAILNESGYLSRFFILSGMISYELYLIHGPLLIKYNPIFGMFSVNYIPISFFIFLFISMLCAFILHLFVRSFEKNKFVIS